MRLYGHHWKMCSCSWCVRRRGDYEPFCRLPYRMDGIQSGFILALLLTMGVIAQEKDKGTAAMILVKPMPRGAFLGGKFFAMAAMFAICLLAAGLACYYYTLLLFEALDTC